MRAPTPSQTIGPFFGILVPQRGPLRLESSDTPGLRISVRGVVRDGAAAPVSDALVEVWQANAAGRWNHPDDPRFTEPDPTFDGFGRIPTDPEGRFRIDTIKPGSVPEPNGVPAAPHLLVGLFARGLHTRLVTRIYFAGEPLNDRDPILTRVPAERRSTLIAQRDGTTSYRFDIALQGPGETVFFDV